MRARVRELSAAGQKIAVSIARGKGKFKRLVTAKIASDGRFTFRFKQKRKGSYRLKYVFKGSATVVAGTYVQKATLY